MQGFDSNLRQGERDMVAGYDGDGRGLAIGFDREFDKHLTAGFAYAYSTASVDASDIAQSNLEISSNQGLVYGRYRKCDIYYMGVLSFANNLYNQQRHILIPAGGPDPAITATATSHFTGWQFNSYFETGIAINNICGFDYFCMVPHAILTYGHLRTHSYKELIDDGMGPNNVLGLTVQNEPQDDAKIGLGIKISHSYCSSKWRYTPYLRFAAMQSIISDAQESFANFNGVFGTGFISTGLGPARSSYLTGVGVEFDMGNNSYITLEYDYEAKTGFQMNSGFIKYRFQWC